MPVFSTVALFFCVFWAVVGPLVSDKIEKRLEWFLLALGATAVTLSGSWNETVVAESLMRPLKVCGAILFGSLIFSFLHGAMRERMKTQIAKIGVRPAVGAAVVLVGFSSAVLTSAIGVLLLIELIGAMDLERDSELKVAIVGCFAVGLGGGLTPIAGPVPAIAMAKLAQAPYATGPYYLFNLLGPWVLPAILSMGVVAGWVFAKRASVPRRTAEDPLTLWNMLVLTGRTYLFIAGLVLLGEGVLPLAERVVLGVPPPVLYWANSVSAAIDGATLASIEINPLMTQEQLRHVLMGILIARGGLVTGNATNLVAAHKLKIPSKEWAKLGTPIAAFLMLFYFISLGAY